MWLHCTTLTLLFVRLEKNGEDAFTAATVNGFTEQIASSYLLQSQCLLRWARSCLHDLYLMLINAQVYVVVQSLDSAWS